MSNLIKGFSFNALGQLIAHVAGGKAKVVGVSKPFRTDGTVIAAVTSGWTAGGVIATLSRGIYLIMPYTRPDAAASATMAEWFLAGNNSNDDTGGLDSGIFNTANTSGSTSGTWAFPGKPFILEVSSSQPIYAKAKSYGANRTVRAAADILKIGELL